MTDEELDEMLVDLAGETGTDFTRRVLARIDALQALREKHGKQERTLRNVVLAGCGVGLAAAGATALALLGPLTWPAQAGEAVAITIVAMDPWRCVPSALWAVVAGLAAAGIAGSQRRRQAAQANGA